MLGSIAKACSGMPMIGVKKLTPLVTAINDLEAGLPKRQMLS